MQWKYWEFEYKKFVRGCINEDIDCGFVNFMIDFINIQHFAKYLNEIYIYNSFGIYRQTMK